MKLKQHLLIVLMIILSSLGTYAQVAVPFTQRLAGGSIRIKGDIVFVGNNITNRAPANSPSDANNPYNGTANNNGLNFEYIDVDGDASTFSSSTANLNISTSCKRIVYAGLYWTATYPFERSGPNGDGTSSNYTGSPRNNTWNQVKFKVPGGTYVDLIADNAADPPGDEDSIIFDGFDATNPSNSFYAAPYVCYKNVTSLVQALANANGTYAVANQRAARGIRPDGISSGWSLVIIYESPTLPSKYISVFDGYANIFNGINAANAVDFNVNGFQTLPAPLPVRARIGVSSLEGDVSLTNDRFRFKANSVAGFTTLSNAVNPADNFFNGSISNNGAIVTTRNPNSTNTLGFDLDIVGVNNPGNAVIPNGETGATLRVTTNGDAYGTYLTSFDVEIIEPVIGLTKVVQDIAGNDIGNAEVQLCQDLVYVIGFQNVGNDDAQNFTIRDILPVNVTFDQLTTAGALPAGVTIQSYNAATREVVFAINNSLVQIGDPRVEIRLRVKVVCSCLEMDDACSNLIQNQAYATYQGVLNTAQITDDPSLSAFLACNLGDPSPSNFLVNLDNCNFTRTEVLCGPSIVLTAANGYESYVWSGPGTITPVPGTNNQSVTVTQPGTYTVNNNINTSPCKSIVETINVITYGAGVTNPVIPYADQVVICPNNGNQLPLIFLCGAGDSQLIQTNITGATGIEWYQLSGTCNPLPAANCPNENVSCTWNPVGTGPNFTVTAAGEYRVIVRFPGGCDRTFYFNAYQNVLNPTYIARDIICSTNGQITVNNVPAGYEYSLSPTGPWQISNIFPISTPGTYTVYIRQVGVTGGCVFTIPNIGIRARNFTASFTLTQPLCTGDKGSINIAANDGEPQYTFIIRQGATVITSAGPIVANNYVFNNLNPGNYTYQVTTQDGCNATGSFTINTPPVLTVTAALTKPLTCTDGEITVYPVGGTAPYNYIITGAVTTTQSSPVIVAPVAGTYNIQVVDFNNCTANTSIVVNQVPPPVFNIVDADILCASSGNSGTITINVTNANGNTLMYSINGNVGPFVSGNVFTNLAPGTYNVVVQYTYGGQVCLTAPQAVVITAPPALTGTATLTTTYTCSHPGVITVTASGGSPGYSYSIDGTNFQPGNTFTVTASGTYTITIRDTNGCTITRTVVVPVLTGPSDLYLKDQVRVTCPSLTGTLNIDVVPGFGGCSPRRFRIVSPITTPYTASGNFAGLPPGAYTFEVIDCNDCTYQETFVLDPLVPTVITPQVVSNVRCFGTATGSGTFTISNIPNSTNYNYTVTNSGGVTITSASGTTPASGSTTITVNLPNLPASTYTISVYNNSNKCTDTASFTITQPASALTATLSSTPITCTTNGTVTVNASGGWGGYVYTITPNVGIIQSGNTFSNITAGTYTVTTTDSGGCAITNSITFTNAPALSATISATSDFCYDSTNAATIVVTPSGGTPPFTYTINGTPNSPNTSNTFGPLTPGTYNIVVTDSFGCTFALPSQTINPQLTLSTNLIKDLDCTASPNAVITGTVAGGYPGYTYTVNGGPVTPIVGTTFTYSTATAGTYNFVVTDTRGCTTATSSVTIAPLSLPQISSVTQTQQILCNGDSTAAINVVINTSVGTAPYVINVFNNTTSTNYGTQTTGLPAGNYTITLTDAKSCTDTETITINQPAPLNFTAVVNPITCSVSGTSLGSICVNGLTGGTAPYTYNLYDITGGTSQTFPAPLPVNHCFTNINFGIYNLEVVDANGCTLIRTNLIMSSPPSDLDIVVSSSIPSCAAGGTAVVSVPGGLGGPYEFAIMVHPDPANPANIYLPADGLVPPLSLQHTFNGLTPGAMYTFVVHDLTTGCYYFEQSTTTIPTNSTMVINPLVANNVTCIGAADGSVTFTVTGVGAGATSVNYTIYNAQTNLSTGIVGVIPAPFPSVNAGPLSPGNYYIQLVENGGVNSGCGIISSTFTISESSTPLAVTATATNDDCNVNGGVITAVGTGGTAPYSYSFVLSPGGPGAYGAPGANTANVESGTYNVYIRDANGCVRSTTVTVNLDPTPVIAATLANACVAQGTYAINVTLPTAGVAPYTLSLDGGAFVTHTFPYTYTGLSSGTHTIQVRDFNGCGNTVNVTILNPLVASAAFTTQPTCNNPNGQITVTTTGGSGNYSYSISPNPGGVITLSTNVFSNVPPGSYTVTITDTTTGCTTTAPANLALPDPVTFTTATTPVICNGDSNGTITVTLSAGNNNPAYTYQITAGPVTTIPQSSNVFTGLPAGSYTILVTSGRGCSTTQNNVIVGTPTVVVASATATPFTCAANNTVNTSTVTITGSGGTGAYTYSINGTNYFTTNTFSIVDNGAVQNITVYVRDANGCIDTDVISINPLPTLVSAVITQNVAITCVNPEQVTVTVTGGSGNFNYELIPASGTATPQPQASNVFTITTTGSYVIRVNDLTTGCYIMTVPYEIAPYDTIQVDVTATNAVTCFGGNDGSIAINITGYSGAYTYNVLDATNTVVLAGAGNTSTNPLPVNGLGAGNYTVQITETNTPFCNELSGVVSVAGPNAALALTAVISSPLTCDPNTAQITATATDGWGTYEYELVGPVNAAFSSNNVFSNLPAGNYTINVRDLEGCLASTSVTITTPLPINTTVTPSTTLLACYGDTNATITIGYPTGGQGSNYSYVFNTIAPVASSSGPIAIPLGGVTISGLGAGTYRVTITDGFNCTFTSSNIVINQPTEVNASLVLTNLPSCNNPTVLTLSANGGTPPYTYSADGITYSAATFNPSVAISIPAGTTGVFHYFVRDFNGCTSVVSNDIQIDPIPAMNLSTLTHVDILCGGSATGTITAVAQGGLGNYVYSLVDAANNPIAVGTQASPGVFTNLPAGTYYISVVSSNAFGTCSYVSGPVIINEPPVFLVSYAQQDVKCNGASDGILTISTTGGTGIIKYAISPNLDQFITVTTPASYNVTGLSAGSYTIIVQDQNGCFDQYNFTINEPTILGASIANIVPEACAEDNAGSFDIVNIIGGTAPYTVTYNVIYSGTTTVVNGPVVNLPLGQNSYTFGNLNGGEYEAIVTDANGCSYSTQLLIDPGVLFTPVAIPTFPCDNNGAFPSVVVEVFNSDNTPSNDFTPLADYQFALDDPTMATAQASNIFTSVSYPALLTPGNHTIYVSNANGCGPKPATFTINADDIDPLMWQGPGLVQGGLNEIVANVQGGTAPYTYTFNGYNNGNDNSYVYDQTGPYTVVVTDANGCFITMTKPFTFIPIYIPDVFTPDGDGNNDEWMPQNTSIYPNLKTKVYDRYGRVVAELNEGQGWNGKYHGNELPTGDYWYVLKVDGNDGQEFVGHFTLYR